MEKKRVVLALGHRALGTTLPQQQEGVRASAKIIADLAEEGCQLIISHSNAPQVGMIHTAMNEFGKAHQDYTVSPMSVCSAMSQGYIGYDLQNAIRAELLSRGIYKTVATLLTQVLVDPYDEAFYRPVKKIGRYLTKEEAEAEEDKGNYVTEVPGKGYQRVVAAPRPGDIVEIDAIRALADEDQIVIACGGGGIPVLAQGSRLKGASAVIEKDLASGRLAEQTDADILMILTTVDQVFLNYGKENETPIDHMTVEEARKAIVAGQFEEATMQPKIVAGVEFVSKKPGRKAIITSIDRARDGLLGKTGTVIE